MKFKIVIYKLKLILSYKENNFYNYKYIVYVFVCYVIVIMIWLMVFRYYDKI